MGGIKIIVDWFKIIFFMVVNLLLIVILIWEEDKLKL